MIEENFNKMVVISVKGSS